MGYSKRILSALALITLSSSAVAVPFTFDARTLGMGGTSVATADLATAAWANPSMLTRQRIEDDFALLIGVGVFVRDNDDLIGDIDDFQSFDDAREAAIDAGDLAGEVSSALQMRGVLAGIEDKVIAPEATGLLAVGIAFETFSMAFSVRSDIIAGGTITDFSCQLTAPGCDPNELFSEDFNILNVEGVQATEYAVSFARDFELWERRVSVGIKPKVVDLRAFTFRESILTVNAGTDTITDEDSDKDLGTLSTFDVGLAVDLTDSVLLGMNFRNLITDDFDLGGATLNFDTEADIGIAYHNDWMTLAMDYDLTENKPLLANDAFTVLKTRYINIGAEFSAGDYVHLRVGAAKNLAGNVSGGAADIQYTAGIGFWLGFNLDIAAIVTDNTVGGMVQTGFRF